MNGVTMARSLLLLGAESMVRTPVDEIAYAHEGWKVKAEQWAMAGERMREHAGAGDPLWNRLCSKFGLSDHGYWLVMLCAAVELIPECAAAASILGEQDRVHLLTSMTFARLMRAAMGTPVTGSLSEAMEGGLARRMGLIETAEAGSSRPFTQQPIRLAPSELAAILEGGSEIGAMQAGLSEVQAPAKGCVFDPAVVAGAARVLGVRGVLSIRSESPRAGRQMAMDIASHLGEPLHIVTVRDEAPAVAAVGRIRDGIPYLDFCAVTRSQGLPLARIAEMQSMVKRLMVGIASDASSGPWPSVAAEPIGYGESQRVWALALNGSGAAPGLVERFRVNLEEARAAVRAAADARLAEPGSNEDAASGVAEQLLKLGSRRMGKAVTQLRSQAQMTDLVAPAALQQKLEEIVTWFRHSGRVFGEMGLPSTSPLGRGLVCLFSGPPGTGKTFAAQCLANCFGLNLYRIDLSQVVSKYIGETEKALAAVFDEAEAGHGLLLCDEADALFGKRSEVKDAHDRYANIEVGYLLQRLEAYDGAVILATNLRNNIDPAFLRRIRFLLDFPMPDRGMRRHLWEQALPHARCRHPELDLTPFVEQFRLAGGNIQNIGLLASHLAAGSKDGLLTASHLVRATYRELEKIGQPRAAGDFGPLAKLLAEGVAQ